MKPKKKKKNNKTLSQTAMPFTWKGSWEWWKGVGE